MYRQENYLHKAINSIGQINQLKLRIQIQINIESALESQLKSP